MQLYIIGMTLHGLFHKQCFSQFSKRELETRRYVLIREVSSFKGSNCTQVHICMILEDSNNVLLIKKWGLFVCVVQLPQIGTITSNIKVNLRTTLPRQQLTSCTDVHGILLIVQEIYCATLANVRNTRCGHGYSRYTTHSTFHLMAFQATNNVYCVVHRVGPYGR